MRDPVLSIIICSKQADISDSLKANIKNTIGIAYELIIIDNSANEYTIFEAYNEGVKRASHDFLCFMHEDVWYQSQDWGKSVIDYLSDTKTGLIGLAGSFYLPAIPSSWSSARPHYLNLVQVNPVSLQTKHCKISEDKEVICVDGFWFCSRKDVFKEVAFDTHTYQGFHFYDMDISMQIHAKGYRIYVVSAIIVEHRSIGKPNGQWIESAYKFFDKWKDRLPDNVNPNFKISTLDNIKAFRDLLYLHIINHYPVSKKTVKIGWNKLNINMLTAFILLFIHILKYNYVKKQVERKVNKNEE
jgi:GT2 family glycosyltransferase